MLTNNYVFRRANDPRREVIICVQKQGQYNPAASNPCLHKIVKINLIVTLSVVSEANHNCSPIIRYILFTINVFGQFFLKHRTFFEGTGFVPYRFRSLYGKITRQNIDYQQSELVFYFPSVSYNTVAVKQLDEVDTPPMNIFQILMLQRKMN